MNPPKHDRSHLESSSGAESASEMTLVVLAAGVGSRYGGLKQLEPVGPGSETLIDYTAFDAARAGFGRIVLVVRPETEQAFRNRLDSGLGSRLRLAYAPQRQDALPEGLSFPCGRNRPWGTGHAVLAAEEHVCGPFAVANADDYYGLSALIAAREYLADSRSVTSPTCALVSYALYGTLSETGAVSRAICYMGPNRELRDIVETEGIERHGRDGRYTDTTGSPHVVDGRTPVSMNLWAFHPTIFGQLRSRFEWCLRERHESDRWEFRLPDAIRSLLKDQALRVTVLQSDNNWCGLTHRGDETQVAERIRSLIEAGHYPPYLWS